MNGFGKGVYAGVSSFFLRYQAQFQPHMRNGIVVALSGGRDSVALTSILRQVYPGKLVAAIIDHGMRPESSEEAQSVALRIKEELDVETQIAKLVWNKGEKKTQASAREKRYHALLSIASRHNIRIVATGHHEDDVVEGLVIRLSNQSGLYGLARMEESLKMYHPRVFKPFVIIRPFLCVARQHITNYCKNNSLTWVDDPSNLSDKYTRNAIRLALREEEGSANISFQSQNHKEEELESNIHLLQHKHELHHHKQRQELLELCMQITNTMQSMRQWVDDVLPTICSTTCDLGWHLNITAYSTYERTGRLALLRQLLIHASPNLYPPSPATVAQVDAFLASPHEETCNKHGVIIRLKHCHVAPLCVFRPSPLRKGEVHKHEVDITEAGIWWRQHLWLEINEIHPEVRRLGGRVIIRPQTRKDRKCNDSHGNNRKPQHRQPGEYLSTLTYPINVFQQDSLLVPFVELVFPTGAQTNTNTNLHFDETNLPVTIIALRRKL
eukprot:m.57975 g.57975  ORF g.57975 m.57975 type:complete len:497 (-) comp7845_c0_seq2:510-2000(-)